MIRMKIDYTFYLVIDDSLCSAETMLPLASLLINCGVTCVQLRMKHSSVATITDIGTALLTLLKPKKIPLLINDHIEIAANIDADGVHIGQNDIAYVEARDYLGYTKIIGLSIENSEQAKKVQHYDVDYFGVGPIFPTTTKRNATNPIGVQQLYQITRQLPKPVVAIGGINRSNMLSVLESGVAGIAFVSAILASAHPESEAKKIMRLIHVQREQNGDH
jgi:thiamine-phosphate pyrophosphorylase